MADIDNTQYSFVPDGRTDLSDEELLAQNVVVGMFRHATPEHPAAKDLLYGTYRPVDVSTRQADLAEKLLHDAPSVADTTDEVTLQTEARISNPAPVTSAALGEDAETAEIVEDPKESKRSSSRKS